MLIHFVQLVTHLQLHAAPICPGLRAQIKAPTAVSNFLLNVNQIGSADRQTAREFANDESPVVTASEIEKRYAATGDFSCGTKVFGQAQVTIKADVITTAAHLIYPSSICPLPSNPHFEKCKFTVKVGGVLRDYDLAGVIDTGYKCRQPHEDVRRNDWLIMRLKTPVDARVKPYGIADRPDDLIDQKNLVQVAKSHDFNTNGQSNMRNVERHYGRCTKQYAYPSGRLIETDCDTSPNSSGGSVLTPGDNPKPLAVVGGYLDLPCKGFASAKVGPYTRGCWAGAAVPVSGDFFRALSEIGSKSDDSSKDPIAPDALPA